MSGGTNGGGWMRLADACGYDGLTKNGAKAFLRDRLAGYSAETVAAVAKAPRTLTSKTDVVGDAFLSSYEWRRLRMQALRKYGARCQCCGASPQTGAVMNVDHIKPRKLFPHLALDLDNLQVLCHECNHGKGNWDQTDWRPEEVDAEVVSILRDIAKHG